MAQSDVHLFTSATEVTIPQVVLEAQACGLDTVAFDLPFMRGSEIVNSDETQEKWCLCFSSKNIACDFDGVETHQRLADELAYAQRFFATRYLPELLQWQRLKARLNIRYLLDRFIRRVVRPKNAHFETSPLGDKKSWENVV